MRLCKDCAFCVPSGSILFKNKKWYDNAWCSHSSAKSEKKDYVTGEHNKISHLSCKMSRNLEHSGCGSRARFWKPKT